MQWLNLPLAVQAVQALYRHCTGTKSLCSGQNVQVYSPPLPIFILYSIPILFQKYLSIGGGGGCTPVHFRLCIVIFLPVHPCTVPVQPVQIYPMNVIFNKVYN